MTGAHPNTLDANVRQASQRRTTDQKGGRELQVGDAGQQVPPPVERCQESADTKNLRIAERAEDFLDSVRYQDGVGVDGEEDARLRITPEGDGLGVALAAVLGESLRVNPDPSPPQFDGPGTSRLEIDRVVRPVVGDQEEPVVGSLEQRCGCGRVSDVVENFADDGRLLLSNDPGRTTEDIRFGPLDVNLDQVDRSELVPGCVAVERDEGDFGRLPLRRAALENRGCRRQTQAMWRSCLPGG